MRAAVGDHPAMQNLDPLAGGALAKAGNECVQETGATGQEQGAGKGERYLLMFQIAFADRLRMTDEQARKHPQIPMQTPR